MNVKVGQWVRFENDIMLITKIEKQDNITWLYVNGGVFSAFGYEMYKNNIKVANDPRELIEVGDLISTIHDKNGELAYVTKIGNNNYIEANNKTNNPHRIITKILTPKGKDYICQWEAKE